MESRERRRRRRTVLICVAGIMGREGKEKEGEIGSSWHHSTASTTADMREARSGGNAALLSILGARFSKRKMEKATGLLL